MSEKMNYKVYVHISPNGKRYYGITKQEIEKRWRNGKGYSNNNHFTNAINYYDWDNFEHIVIARGLTEEEAKWLEVELIRELDTTNGEYGYNITKGGEGTNGLKHSEETRKKLSEINKGKSLSEEHKKNISKAKKGCEVTEGARKKMSESHKGENNAMYGKSLSEEHKKNISKANKGKNNPSATQVYCIELNLYFNTITEASEYVGCSISNISSVLTGKWKTAKGYHWLYDKDVNEENINKVLNGECIGKNDHIATKVYCVELDKYFNSITEASKYVDCNKSSISRALKGNRGQKTAGGYHWVYAEDRDK